MFVIQQRVNIYEPDAEPIWVTLRPGGLLPYKFIDPFIPPFIPLMVIALCYPEVPGNQIRVVEVVEVQEAVKHD
jgi:hypothetical protein